MSGGFGLCPQPRGYLYASRPVLRTICYKVGLYISDVIHTKKRLNHVFSCPHRLGGRDRAGRGRRGYKKVVAVHTPPGLRPSSPTLVKKQFRLPQTYVFMFFCLKNKIGL